MNNDNLYNVYASVNNTIVLLFVRYANDAEHAVVASQEECPLVANTIFALPYPEQKAA
jgi:hypothetical protein